MAQVDLVIGGQNKGTFYFGDANHAEYTIKNVSHGTGNQKIELVVNADDGNWDAYVDKLIISGDGVSSSGSSSSGSTSGGTTGGTTSGTTSTSDKIECESQTITGQYAGTISSPFNGVALYANNESVKFTQYFANGTHDFTLRGASNGNNMAQVDLKIGGETKGTFYFGDSYAAEYTISNVSHGTGNQQVELVVTADDGNWDAYLDYLQIGTAGSSSNNSGNTGNTSGNISSSSKLVALTFDDGPSTTTSQVLDILDQYDAVATFFLIGQQIDSSMLSTMQRQVNMGCELANHSYTHQDMSGMSASDVKNQIEWTSSAIKNAVG